MEVEDKLLNKACALYALQPPLPSNWNKRNKASHDFPVLAHRAWWAEHIYLFRIRPSPS